MKNPTSTKNLAEKKTTEEALRDSEERYQALFDSAPLCIKLFNAQGNLITVNKRGREEHFLVGKSEEEIKKWDYMSCIDESSKAELKEKMKQVFNGGSYELVIKHAQGTSTGQYCLSSLTPVKNGNGNIQYVLFISKDITAEKIANEKFAREEEAKNKTLAELQKFQELTVGRELKMIELKKKLAELKKLYEDKLNK